MSAAHMATLVEGAIPILGGLYITLLGYGHVRPPMEAAKFEQWRAENGRFFRIGGPFLMLFGVFLVVSGFLRG